MTSEETNRINRDLHRLKLYEKDLQKWYGIDSLTSATEKDSKNERCPKCGGNVVFATLSIGDMMRVSHNFCLCGHHWDSDRGLPEPLQAFLF
jgi:ribosomal protein S27AE